MKEGRACLCPFEDRSSIATLTLSSKPTVTPPAGISATAAIERRCAR